MSNSITPNMGLIQPEVGVEPGPDWATDLNANASAIDGHNHTSGQGVPITPDGLNINADFPQNNNNITTVKTLRFTPQSSIVSGGSNIGCLQEVGVDLYYIDGSGNQIRITQTGSVAGSSGTITGLPSGTASAAFAAGTFTFQKSTNTPASLSVGSVKIAQEVASGFGVTISANGSQSSNYALSLPQALPASTKIVTIDSSGNVGDTLYVDGSTLEVSSNNIQIKDSGVSTAKIADGAVTKVKEAAVGQQTSSSCGLYSTSSGSYTSVTNLAITITTIGRPLIVVINPVGTDSSPSCIGGTAGDSYRIRLINNAGGTTEIYNLRFDAPTGFVPFQVTCMDFPAAGTWTYTVQVKCNAGTFLMNNYELIAYEL